MTPLGAIAAAFDAQGILEFRAVVRERNVEKSLETGIADPVLNPVQAFNNGCGSVSLAQERDHEMGLAEENGQQHILPASVSADDGIQFRDPGVRIPGNMCLKSGVITVLTAFQMINPGVVAPGRLPGVFGIAHAHGKIRIMDLQEILPDIAVAGGTADAQFFGVRGINVSHSLFLIPDQRRDDLIDMIEADGSGSYFPTAVMKQFFIVQLGVPGRIAEFPVGTVGEMGTAVTDPRGFQDSWTGRRIVHDKAGRSQKAMKLQFSGNTGR